MGRVTVTIHIDYPEGSVAVVAPPPAAATDAPLQELPYPAGPATQAPGNECPIHHQPFRNGARGPYCSAKASNGGPADPKGYCALKPGMDWQGRRIPS